MKKSSTDSAGSIPHELEDERRRDARRKGTLRLGETKICKRSWYQLKIMEYVYFCRIVYKL
jgi:hypothetical protein